MQKNKIDNRANLSFLFRTKDLIEIMIEIKVITKILILIILSGSITL